MRIQSHLLGCLLLATIIPELSCVQGGLSTAFHQLPQVTIWKSRDWGAEWLSPYILAPIKCSRLPLAKIARLRLEGGLGRPGATDPVALEGRRSWGPEDVDSMTVEELRAALRAYGLTSLSRLKKDDLQQLLRREILKEPPSSNSIIQESSQQPHPWGSSSSKTKAFLDVIEGTNECRHATPVPENGGEPRALVDSGDLLVNPVGPLCDLKHLDEDIGRRAVSKILEAEPPWSAPRARGLGHHPNRHLPTLAARYAASDDLKPKWIWHLRNGTSIETYGLRSRQGSTGAENLQGNAFEIRSGRQQTSPGLNDKMRQPRYFRARRDGSSPKEDGKSGTGMEWNRNGAPSPRSPAETVALAQQGLHDSRLQHLVGALMPAVREEMQHISRKRNSRQGSARRSTTVNRRIRQPPKGV